MEPARRMLGFYPDILPYIKQIQEFSRTDYLVNERLPLPLRGGGGDPFGLHGFFYQKMTIL
jgi:hypothetical protein